jgi:hypothetical protein
MIPIPTNIPWRLLAGVAGVAIILGTIGWLQHSRQGWKATAATNEQLYHGEQIAHRLTVANYRAQAVKAAQADKDNVVRVKAEQTAINVRTTNEYEARIADARGSYQRLQPLAGTAPGHPSGSATASVSPGAQHSPGAAGSTQEAQLSAPDALIATEQAIQLDELEKAVIAQQAISTNGNQQ